MDSISANLPESAGTLSRKLVLAEAAIKLSEKTRGTAPPARPALNKSFEARLSAFRKCASVRIARLTPRQTEVLDLIIAGQPSKTIAFDLHISQRTVENHRAAIAKAIDAQSLPELVQTAACARCALNVPADESLELQSMALDASVSAATGDGLDTPEMKYLPRPEAAARNAQGCALCAAKNGVATHDCEMQHIDKNEIMHRVKNMVAVIQSISHQTMRHCTTKDEFDERFTGRLGSYCSSITQLIDNDWHSVKAHALVRSQLDAFGALDGKEITLTGPEVRMTPKAAHNISLALHELATNSVKYGSLSVPQGHVAVSWAVADAEGKRRFQMTWSEYNGPVVKPPTRQGFGCQMIERLAAMAVGGTASYEFAPSGVLWTIDIPEASAIAAR